MLALMRFTPWLGEARVLDAATKRKLWLRGGLSLAAYIVAFNWALRFTSASHVAIYLGASPVWALLWEGRVERNWHTVRRYGAALLALCGVTVLSWPALHSALGKGDWRGELLGLTCSILWTNFGRQTHKLGANLSGVESSAHSMWRAGVLLAPLAAIELWNSGLTWSADLLGVQAYCIIAGGVAAFVIWNNSLRYWPTSQVLLFNNLIPLSTLLWAHVCLKEKITSTFWIAMFLVVSGVLLGQLKGPESKKA
jgi:drug/metabolite transporter (DMT)-like permease